MLEPRQGPAGIGVELPLLLGQHLVHGMVDQRQGVAHGYGIALGVEHLGVAGVDRHAGTDGGLGEIDRGDVAGLQVREGRGKLGLEGGDELAAGGQRGVRATLAADEDDAGGEGVDSAF